MPARGRVLIKKPDTEECLPGGSIIIPEKSREAYAANQFLVVSVGESEACEWPEDCEQETHAFPSIKLTVHPIDPRIVPGAWVVVRPRSLVDAGDGLYLVRQTDILGVFAVELPEVA
jgi:hypothetical protein